MEDLSDVGKTFEVIVYVYHDAENPKPNPTSIEDLNFLATALSWQDI